MIDKVALAIKNLRAIIYIGVIVCSANFVTGKPAPQTTVTKIRTRSALRDFFTLSLQSI